MSTIKYFVVFMILLIFLVTTGFVHSSDDNKKVYENFSSLDYNNKNFSLKDFTDKKGIVIIFISTKCPVSNAYNGRMAKLLEKYNSNFSIVGINSNKSENIEEIKKHAEENNLNFVILKDINNIIADKFDASFTPEVYVLSNDFEKLYHGRIDDSRREKDVEVEDLKNALNEIVKGDEVKVKSTKAFGCSIKRVN